MVTTDTSRIARSYASMADDRDLAGFAALGLYTLGGLVVASVVSNLAGSIVSSLGLNDAVGSNRGRAALAFLLSIGLAVGMGMGADRTGGHVRGVLGMGGLVLFVLAFMGLVAVPFTDESDWTAQSPTATMSSVARNPLPNELDGLTRRFGGLNPLGASTHARAGAGDHSPGRELPQAGADLDAERTMNDGQPVSHSYSTNSAGWG